MEPKIGFVGLGIMGRGMAENLLKAGYDLVVYNRTKSKAMEMVAMGATVANSPALAAEGRNVVITMLADPVAVRDSIFGTEGVIEGIEKDGILIDCSTVDPATSAETKAAVEARGARFLDSPVAGSKDAAAKGELILMVGGDEAVLEEVRPVLEVISKRIIYAGPAGSGTMVKLCFNLAVSHIAVALSEALVLGVKSGLKPDVIVESMMAGTIGSRFIEWKGGCIMDRDFTTNFSTKLMHKDLGLIMSAGQELDVPLPVSAAVRELFAMAKARGHSEEDFISVVKLLEELVNVEVRR